MTPVVAFLLGIGLMLVTNGFLLWATWSWLTDPRNTPHLILGLFSSLRPKSIGIAVRDTDGRETLVRWEDLGISVTRASERIRKDVDLEAFL